MTESPIVVINQGLPPLTKNNKSLVPPHVEIGKRFRLARGARSVKEIERLSGISDTVIGKCEKGQQIPNLDLLAYYDQAENIPIGLILFGAKTTEDRLAALRIECLALPPDQRHALGLELLSAPVPPDAQ